MSSSAPSTWTRVSAIDSISLAPNEAGKLLQPDRTLVTLRIERHQSERLLTFKPLWPGREAPAQRPRWMATAQASTVAPAAA